MASVTSARRRSVSTVVNVVLAVIALTSCFLLGRGARNGLRADLKANPLPSPDGPPVDHNALDALVM